MSDEARVAVLLSGRGSNFLSLHAAMERGELPARIVVVVSNKSKAAGLAKARELGLPAIALPRRRRSREQHDLRVVEVLREHGVEWVCLAGYMRLLSPSFVAAFPRRILNIHPSLLPAFPGLEAQQQALQHGVRVSGCTVHLVDDGLDSGPVVVQKAVPVMDDDTADTLASRILAEEHRAYPEALGRLLGSDWEVDGRRIRWREPRNARD
ncbi:MAG: phosphoribosylglycinamide formyltransferase [Acidobacteriota bacterium]